MKKYWYQDYNNKVPFKSPAIAKKPTSHFVALLSTMISIDPKLDLVSFWNIIQDSVYESQI
jgi:hypothetical protein